MVLVKLFIQPVYVCRLANIPYSQYTKRSAKTMAAVAGSPVLPLLLTLKFAAPSYRVLFPIGILSAILYVVPLWLFEFSQAETIMLTRAVWPKFAVKPARE
jgi:hypothetical protein